MAQDNVPPVLATLRAARRLLVERGWTQGAFGRDAAGSPVPRGERRAACYCALGAVAVACPGYEVADSLGRIRAKEALNRAVPAESTRWPDRRFVSRYNDEPTTTLADILALYDRAIAAAEAP